MSPQTLLDAAAAMAAPQGAARLNQRILDLAAGEDGTACVALYIDDVGALGPASDAPPDVPLDAAPDSDACWVRGWRLVPLCANGSRVGLLALRRPDGTSALETLAPHMGAALAAAANYSMLEALVTQEMATAVAREEAIQLILDNMSDGLLVVDLQGKATVVRSKSVVEWLGEVPETEAVWAWLAGGDERLATSLEMNFAQIAWDVLPFDVSAAQMPGRVTSGSRTFALTYSQVFEGEQFDRVLISIRDITAALQAERDGQARREMDQIVKAILSNMQGFRDGLQEMQRLVDQLREVVDPQVRARVLHTIKGSGAILGFTSFAKEIHEVEDLLADDGEAWGESLQQRVTAAWATALESVRPLVSGEEPGVNLHIEEYETFVDMLETRGADADLLDVVASWSARSVGGTFDRYERMVERLSERKGKQVRVKATGAHVRVRGEGQDAVISALVHVLRNAMEHGFESAEERTAAGKRPAGTLTLHAEDLGDRLRLVVADDGRGIDLGAVRANGARVGCTPESDLFGCLCAGSTRTEANLEAGRGVGMAALRDAVRHLDGSVRVQTQLGRGTRFVIEVPTLPFVRSARQASNL